MTTKQVEGELKKRIQELAEDARKSGLTYDDAEDIFKILDEAAKEFPIQPWRFGDFFDLSEEEQHAIFEWFKKWFGEANR